MHKFEFFVAFEYNMHKYGILTPYISFKTKYEHERIQKDQYAYQSEL
jgi:hypothetical protein